MPYWKSHNWEGAHIHWLMPHRLGTVPLCHVHYALEMRIHEESYSHSPQTPTSNPTHTTTYHSRIQHIRPPNIHHLPGLLTVPSYLFPQSSGKNLRVTFDSPALLQPDISCPTGQSIFFLILLLKHTTDTPFSLSRHCCFSPEIYPYSQGPLQLPSD